MKTLDTDDYSVRSAGTDPTGVHTVVSGASDSTRSASGAVSVAGRSAASSSSSSRSSDRPNYALVLRRSEYTPNFARLLRAAQAAFFESHYIDLPPASRFRGTLHGR